MAGDSLDKLMYSFVMEDVLKGVFVTVPPGYVACVYDMGRGVLKKVLTPGLHLKIPFWQKAKLFNDLVVPNWVLSYNNRIVGGKYNEVEHDDSDSEDEVIEDDLHEKLLDLVKEHDAMVKQPKKKMTRRMKKSVTKKGGTKRRK